MDLELIGKKMLEALAIQGQLAGLEAKLTSLNAEVVEAGENIVRAANKKAATLESLSSVKVQLNTATGDLFAKRAEVETAQRIASTAEGKVRAIQIRLDTEYTEDVIKQLDTNIHALVTAKEALQRQTSGAAQQVVAARQNFEARQAELKAEGVELNIGKREGRVTVL